MIILSSFFAISKKHDFSSRSGKSYQRQENIFELKVNNVLHTWSIKESGVYGISNTMMVRVGLAAGENKNAGARAGKTIKMGVRKDCSKNGVICLKL